MNGALIIDKPAGMTSHDVVARVRKLTGERRTGHTGTLDPFARGVLVLLLGRATRLAQFLSGAEKEYDAVIRLGYETDTADVTGTRVRNLTKETQRTTEIHREEIEAAMASLRREIDQVPPMYSAKKVGGRKLYELARQGEEIERKAVRIVISEFTAIALDGPFLKQNEDGSRDLRARVICSAGTYVRTLAEDLGKKLGTGAHLAELCRTRAGRFKIENAITLDRLAELAGSGSLNEVVISTYDVLSHLPTLLLSADDARRAVHGIDIQISGSQVAEWPHGQRVRMCVDRELIAVGMHDANRNIVHPSIVLADG